jgi:Ca2+-binding RTX toxin-like protein
LSSAATAANVQTLVRAITYQNTDTDNPTTGARTVRTTVNDGDGGTSANADVTVTVAAVNDVPTIANLGSDSFTFTEGAAATVIDQSTAAVLADVDSSNFSGGNLTVTIASGEDSAEDVLSLSTSGTVALASTNANANVSVGGTVVGTLGNAISAGNDLVVSLNSAATAANVQTLVRAITYQNTDTDNPTTGNRIVRTTVNDGDGGTSANADVTVTVAAVNDAPAAAADTVKSNTSSLFTIPKEALILNDSDAEGSSLSIAAVNNLGGSNGTAEIVNGDVTFTAASGATSGQFTYTVSDGSATSSAATVSLTIGSGATISGGSANEILIGGGTTQTTLDFASGSGTPVTYTEDGMTVESVYSGGGDHLHFSSGALRNHSGCCSSPYKFTLADDAAFDLVSFQITTSNGNSTFTGLNSSDQTTGTQNLTSSSSGTITLPSGFTDITTVNWAQSSGSLNIDNLIFSQGAGNTITGGDGADFIVGASKADVLTGNDGNDIIVGAGGSDTLTGGGGADIFGYEATSDGGAVSSNQTASNASITGDSISGFATGTDKFYFVSSGFENISAGSLTTGTNFSIINAAYDGTNAGTNSEFTASDPTFIFDSTDTLYYDANGSSAGYTVIATTTGSVNIAVGDIEIVTTL